MCPCPGHVHKIGDHDIEIGKQHVDWGKKDFAEGMRFEMMPEQIVQIPSDSLVPRRWRWRHEVLPIDDLVSQTIVGEQHVVGVGKLGRGMSGPHCRLLQARIVPSSSRVGGAGGISAFGRCESERDEIYVRPFPAVDTGKWQVSSGGGAEPKWAADGRTLFFAGPAHMMAAAIDTDPTFASGTPEALFGSEGYLFVNNVHHYDVSPDRERFLLMRNAEVSNETAPSQIIVVQNWFEELKRLAPRD